MSAYGFRRLDDVIVDAMLQRALENDDETIVTASLERALRNTDNEAVAHQIQRALENGGEIGYHLREALQLQAGVEYHREREILDPVHETRTDGGVIIE